MLIYHCSKRDQESLAYRKTVIENLSWREREATRNYRELQRLVQASEAQLRQTIFLNGVVTTENVTSPFPPYEDATDTRSKVEITDTSSLPTRPDHSRPHIGELVLLFNLVQNLLNHHINNVTSSLQYKSYLQLRKATESAHEAELELLEKDHGEAAFRIGAEAARNAIFLQLRLRELAAKHQFILEVKRETMKTDLPILQGPRSLPDLVTTQSRPASSHEATQEAKVIKKRRRQTASAVDAEDCFVCLERRIKCDRRRPYCESWRVRILKLFLPYQAPNV
jgi:hypothetical protein